MLLFIKELKFLLDSRKNKQIDKKGYGGIKTIRKQTLRAGYKDYPKENFENIVRLKEPLPKEAFFK